MTENGETFEWPVNYTNNYTHEPMTVQYAVQQSINTVPAQIVNILTPQVCYDTLKNKFQISTLQEADATSLSAMALGGMTTGMTLEELVAATRFLSPAACMSNLTPTPMSRHGGQCHSGKGHHPGPRHL